MVVEEGSHGETMWERWVELIIIVTVNVIIIFAFTIIFIFMTLRLVTGGTMAAVSFNLERK